LRLRIFEKKREVQFQIYGEKNLYYSHTDKSAGKTEYCSRIRSAGGVASNLLGRRSSTKFIMSRNSNKFRGCRRNSTKFIVQEE
jgi:hypothetical protein